MNNNKSILIRKLIFEMYSCTQNPSMLDLLNLQFKRSKIFQMDPLGTEIFT